MIFYWDKIKWNWLKFYSVLIDSGDKLYEYDEYCAGIKEASRVQNSQATVSTVLKRQSSCELHSMREEYYTCKRQNSH